MSAVLNERGSPMKISRRNFLAAAASAGPSMTCFPNWSFGQAAAPRVRFDVSSPQGEAMVEKYARAVGKMMSDPSIPEKDPKSWLFQWYMHAVRDDRTEQSEITRVYSGVPNNDPQ